MSIEVFNFIESATFVGSIIPTSVTESRFKTMEKYHSLLQFSLPVRLSFEFQVEEDVLIDSRKFKLPGKHFHLPCRSLVLFSCNPCPTLLAKRNMNHFFKNFAFCDAYILLESIHPFIEFTLVVM
jgi:hypothetical protein